MDTSPRTSIEKLIQHPESSSLDESEGPHWAKERHHEGQNLRRRVLVISLMAISFLINIALAIVVHNALLEEKSDAGQGRYEFTLPCTHLTFWNILHLESDFIKAPADTAISHKLVKFQNGINSDTTRYQGMPTTENNRLWKELYERKFFWY